MKSAPCDPALALRDELLHPRDHASREPAGAEDVAAEPVPADPAAAGTKPDPHGPWLKRCDALDAECVGLVETADRCDPRDEGLYMTMAYHAGALARRYAELIHRTPAATPEGDAAKAAVHAVYGDELDTIPEEVLPGVRAGLVETAGIEEDRQ